MPAARLVDKAVATTRRRGRTAQVEQELTAVRQLLKQAVETGRVIELALAADERDETVKVRYRTAARELGYTIQCHTGHQRSYTNRKGKQEYEADVLLVFVTPSTAEPEPEAETGGTDEQPGRRRRAAVA